MRWFWFLCLTIGAVSDVRDRSVSGWLLIVCGIGGLTGWRGGEAAGHLAGAAAGLGLLAVSRITKGAVGTGDGVFILASAGYLKTEEIWGLLLGAMGISWIWSMILILYGAWTRKDIYKDTIPFLACMWPVGLLILI